MMGEEESVQAEEEHEEGAVLADEQRPHEEDEESQKGSVTRVSGEERKRKGAAGDHRQPQDYCGRRNSSSDWLTELVDCMGSMPRHAFA